MTAMSKKSRWLVAPAMLLATACTGGEEKDDEVSVPEAYTFESKFVPGESSVSYSGQVFRHLMILELNATINGMTARLDADTYNPGPGDVVADLNFFYDFDMAAVTTGNLMTTTEPATLQATYADVAANGANMRDKIAGNDTGAVDWSTTGIVAGIASVGTASGMAYTPDQLIQAWFAELDALAVARANGDIPVDPVQSLPIEKVQVTEQGRDVRQLLQKFLWGAVTLSQASDDYLDDGLMVTNEHDPQSTDPFTELEHHWDEGFGYFGASRDFGKRTIEEIADSAAYDTNGDMAIDLLTEYSFGHSRYGAQRDASSVSPTNFSGEAFDALITGRAIIHDAAGRELTDGEWEEVYAQRDIAIANWEKSIAASVVHYMNETIVDTTALESGTGYDFHDHAAHWSEMKGFALALQFNPYSPLSDADFATLHEKIGDAPVLDTDETAAYKAAILEARAILQAAYGFDPANMGDDDGLNGW